ncbi:hypothetical protein K449DRAFT_438501 [Hypoxylon sp. EC38]|nr:hypothetical protein K449DRAFT_438501 [Hypoxylon sp. EC38]
MSLKIHINAKQVHDAISLLPSFFLSSSCRVSFRGRERRLVSSISLNLLLRRPKRSLATISWDEEHLGHDTSHRRICVDVAAQNIRSTKKLFHLVHPDARHPQGRVTNKAQSVFRSSKSLKLFHDKLTILTGHLWRNGPLSRVQGKPRRERDLRQDRRDQDGIPELN